jgi:hypothetical protein
LKPAGWEHGGVIDMFNGEYSGPIGPWNPSDHPEWEQTHQAFQNFFTAFSASTWHQSYAEPVMINPHLAGYFPAPGGQLLLMQLTLPSLAENRGWVKAVMAEAWRAENGTVPPQQMIDSLGTVLRNTGLIAQGPSLVHDLVSIAEQNLAYDNARLALKHGVFSTPVELAVAFQTLVQSDVPPQDPARLMRLEYASAMDAVQYLFPPAGPGQEAQLDPQRAAYMAGLLREISSREAEPYIDQIAQMTPEDGKRAVEALDGFFREVTEKMRTGYPQVRQTDLKAIWEKYQAAGPVVSPFISSMDRVHHIRGRVEAARRATQLTYAVHLFKAQYGRWPSSLAELPAEYGSTIRTDPFTGGYFGYQVTDSGPQIYTLGEDGLDNGAHSLDWGDSRKKGGVDSDDYYFWPPD